MDWKSNANVAIAEDTIVNQVLENWKASIKKIEYNAKFLKHQTRILNYNISFRKSILAKDFSQVTQRGK